MRCARSMLGGDTGGHELLVCSRVRVPRRLLIYGEYCSHMEHAQHTLNQLLASREDFRQKVEVGARAAHPEGCGGARLASGRVPSPPAALPHQECTLKVQEGKFKLQDLLVVPMQRVLKYHLLLKVGSSSGATVTGAATDGP